jgi:hypothetical protein
MVRARVRAAGEDLTQIGRRRIVLIERRQAEDEVHGLEDARQAQVLLGEVLALHPGTDREEDRAVTVDVVEPVLRVVLDDEDDRVSPTGSHRTDCCHCLRMHLARPDATSRTRRPRRSRRRSTPAASGQFEHACAPPSRGDAGRSRENPRNIEMRFDGAAKPFKTSA